MDHRDAELADVVVILADPLPLPLHECVQQLKTTGMSVDDIDAENGAIEGTIRLGLFLLVEALPFVQYVRKIFEYTADYPAGDPRDQDGPESDAK